MVQNENGQYGNVKYQECCKLDFKEGGEVEHGDDSCYIALITDPPDEST